MKKIFVSVIILFFIISCLTGWGLYLMEIDDHYGDMQEVFFDSKSGDIIINKQTKQFGIITKTWKRADVITKKNDTLDLYDLIYKNQEESKYEVFRSEEELKINELSFEKILELKSKNLLKTIIVN